MSEADKEGTTMLGLAANVFAGACRTLPFNTYMPMVLCNDFSSVQLFSYHMMYKSYCIKEDRNGSETIPYAYWYTSDCPFT